MLWLFHRFLAFIFVSIIFYGTFPLYASATVDHFEFLSAPSSLSVNDASCVFTIQARDGNDVSVQVGETFDIHLNSSSSTGEFSSNTTSWLSVTALTMNSNWANRSFYYRDSQSGNVTVEVTASPRSGGQEFNTSHTLTIGGSSSCSTENTESGTEEATAESREEVIAPALKDPLIPVYDVQIIIHPPVMAGIQTRFETVVTKNKEMRLSTGVFRWSMGDGILYEFSKNETVLHTYEYPGDYLVVFEYYRSPLVDVPTEVKTIPISVLPFTVKLSFTEDKGGIRIENIGNADVSLGGSFFRFPEGEFIFPSPTILRAKKQMTVSGTHVGISSLKLPTTLSLVLPNGAVADTLVYQDPSLMLKPVALMVPTEISIVRKEEPKEKASFLPPPETEEIIENSPSAITESAIPQMEASVFSSMEANKEGNHSWLWFAFGALTLSLLPMVGIYYAWKKREKEVSPSEADTIEIIE